MKRNEKVFVTVVPNDLSKILEYANIQQIYANGEKAYRIYMKYCYKNIGKDIIKLPSTSPANASYNFARLRDEWEKKVNVIVQHGS